MTKYLLVCLLFFVVAIQCQSCDCNVVLDLKTDANVKVGVVNLNYNGDLVVTVDLDVAADLLKDVHILVATALDIEVGISLLDAYEINLSAINENTVSGKIPLTLPCGVSLRPRISATILQNGSTEIEASTVSVAQNLLIDLDVLAEVNLCCSCLSETVGSLLGENSGIDGLFTSVTGAVESLTGGLVGDLTGSLL